MRLGTNQVEYGCSLPHVRTRSCWENGGSSWDLAERMTLGGPAQSCWVLHKPQVWRGRNLSRSCEKERIYRKGVRKRVSRCWSHSGRRKPQYCRLALLRPLDLPRFQNNPQSWWFRLFLCPWACGSLQWTSLFLRNFSESLLFTALKT